MRELPVGWFAPFCREYEMNIRYLSSSSLLVFALWSGSPAWADDVISSPPVSSEMTQEEYAAYRARIREQMEAAEQSGGKEEERSATRRRSSDGYGQGYRTRQERARSSGGMGYGGGRGR